MKRLLIGLAGATVLALAGLVIWHNHGPDDPGGARRSRSTAIVTPDLKETAPPRERPAADPAVSHREAHSEIRETAIAGRKIEADTLHEPEQESTAADKPSLQAALDATEDWIEEVETAIETLVSQREDLITSHLEAQMARQEAIEAGGTGEAEQREFEELAKEIEYTRQEETLLQVELQNVRLEHQITRTAIHEGRDELSETELVEIENRERDLAQMRSQMEEIGNTR